MVTVPIAGYADRRQLALLARDEQHAIGRQAEEAGARDWASVVQPGLPSVPVDPDDPILARGYPRVDHSPVAGDRQVHESLFTFDRILQDIYPADSLRRRRVRPEQAAAVEDTELSDYRERVRREVGP